MKKLMALLLVAVLIAVMAVPALALAGNGKGKGSGKAKGSAARSFVSGQESGTVVEAPSTEAEGGSAKAERKAAKAERKAAKAERKAARSAVSGVEADEAEAAEPSDAVIPEPDESDDVTGVGNAFSRITANMEKSLAKVAAGTKKQVPPGLMRVWLKFAGWLGIDPATMPGAPAEPASVEPSGTIAPAPAVEPTPTPEPDPVAVTEPETPATQ